jgi:DNA integrity scanning protein DisA with diadenylate cyclase activity
MYHKICIIKTTVSVKISCFIVSSWRMFAIWCYSLCTIYHQIKNILQEDIMQEIEKLTSILMLQIFCHIFNNYLLQWKL